MPAAQPILEAKAQLGEGARWHGGEQRLYWVDIGRNELHRFDPAPGQDECRSFASPVTSFAFCNDGGMVLAMADGFALLKEWAAEPEPIGPRFLAGTGLRLNDGRADTKGRFWAGSYDAGKTGKAALYRLDSDGSVTEIEGGMMTSNGHCFSPDGTRFLHSDTASHAVSVYDCDAEAGTLSNKRILHQFPFGQGRPDGGSLDAQGCYWVALYDGGRVVRLSSEGEILAEVALPVTRPTMIALGGPDLKTAYVTSVRAGLSDQELNRQPLAGAIFAFPVDIPGIAEAEYLLR